MQQLSATRSCYFLLYSSEIYDSMYYMYVSRVVPRRTNEGRRDRTSKATLRIITYNMYMHAPPPYFFAEVVGPKHSTVCTTTQRNLRQEEEWNEKTW
jgi:hypothetical protein